MIAVVMLCTAFYGCSEKRDEQPSVSNGGAVATEGARLKESDAINYIKNSYTIPPRSLV